VGQETLYILLGKGMHHGTRVREKTLRLYSQMVSEQTPVNERNLTGALNCDNVAPVEFDREGSMNKFTVTEAALEYARESKVQYPKEHPLHMFWWGLEEELVKLQSGDWEEEDGSPFVCYSTLADTPLGEAFLEAWGLEIGRFGGAVHRIAGDLIDSLEERG